MTACAQAALGQCLSRSTVWRMLAADALKPWRYQYWSFPRDPHFAEKAGPIDVANVEAIQLCLALYEEWSNQRPTPFQWKFDRTELVTLLAKIEAHPKFLSDVQFDCTEEAT